jgi:hypothetical protein
MNSKEKLEATTSNAVIHYKTAMQRRVFSRNVCINDEATSSKSHTASFHRA